MNVEFYSSLLLVSSVVVFTCALVAHAAEWAAARRLTDSTPAASPAPTPTTSAPTASVGARAAVSAAASTHSSDGSSGAADATAPGPGALPSSSGRSRRVTALAAPAPSRPPKVDLFGRVGVSLAVVGWLLTVAGVVLRGVAAQRLPWGNMLEFLTTAMVFIVAVYLLLVWRADARWLGLPVMMLAAVGNGLAVTVFYVAVAPLVPALQSVWFIIHIVAAAISAAAFNVGGLAAVLYLLKGRAERRGSVTGYLRLIPNASTLDLYSYRFHAFAFPLWTFTVAAGAIWAEYAWGRYWGWDPKETWALVTWIVYACYLHARATAGWRGGKAAAVALLGLATFWFNFIGINLLVSGLHSYAGI